MIRSRQTLIGSGIAVAAIVALSMGVGSSQAQPAAAACSVTPVIPADVALGASPNLGLPSIEIPISFQVMGTCNAPQLASIRWDGASRDEGSVLGVIGVGFGFKAGSRPEEVPLRTLKPGLIQVEQVTGPERGVRVVTRFRTRRGTWLSPTATPAANVVSLLAQEWANDSWQPLGGRVLLQELRGGTWVNLKSKSLGRTGRATMTYPLTRQVRFLVPGTKLREPAVLAR